MPDLTTFFGPTQRTVTRSGERRTVSITRPYAGTPAELWSACTDPDRLARWLGEITGDRVPGGELRLTMSPPDQDIAVLRVEVLRRTASAIGRPGAGPANPAHGSS